MTSTRGNPRLGQSGVALTSLGAVGGARGVAAGGLRVLVEFITQYNSGEIKNLENDLRQLEFAQRNSEIAERKRLSRIAIAQKQLNEIKVVERKLTREQRSELASISSLETSRLKANRTRAVELKKQLSAELSGTAKAQGLLKGDIDLLFRRTELEKRLVVLKRQQEEAATRQSSRNRQIAATESQLAQANFGRQSIGARLGGLAIGAVGGIVGGAVLGVGFQLAETAIEKVGDAIQDLIDPARHAREEVKALADAVNSVADSKAITNLQAAQEFLKGVGVDPTSESGSKLANLLAEVSVREKINAQVSLYTSLLDVQKNQQKLNEEQVQKLAEAILEEGKANGTATQRAKTYIVAGRTTVPIFEDLVNGIEVHVLAQQRLNEVTGQYTNVAYNAAAAAEAQAIAAQRAAALASIAVEQLQEAIATAGALRLSGIDTKIENLGSGESRRTRRLQARLENAQNSGGGSGRSSALRNLAEERALILLRQRLRLLGTAINLERYEGKFLLEAINAKINALQKEGDEIGRVNRLLDLQYRMSQTINRQEGETIADFIERRAQEQRKQLQERDDIEREAKIARLEARREEVEDEVALAELAQRKKDALQAAGNASYIKGLQKQLDASKKADAKALEEKRKALQKQREQLQKAIDEATRLVQDGVIDQTRVAIAGANNVSKINSLAGRIAGYQRAKATIQALVQGFGLPAGIAKPFLDKINSLLDAYSAQYERVARNQLPSRNGAAVPFAKGGIIELKNSRSPFGSNVRFGEEGSEIGVVLSHKVAEILKNQKGGLPEQTFNFYGSQDPLRDKYAFGKLVENAVEAALG